MSKQIKVKIGGEYLKEQLEKIRQHVLPNSADRKVWPEFTPGIRVYSDGDEVELYWASLEYMPAPARPYYAKELEYTPAHRYLYLKPKHARALAAELLAAADAAKASAEYGYDD